MYDPEMRKDCPMRGNLGNCSPVGGFCLDAVSDEICEAVHNAYYCGFHNALKTMKEQEPVLVTETENPFTGLPVTHCPRCGLVIDRYLYGRRIEGQINHCPWCGKAVKWNE